MTAKAVESYRSVNLPTLIKRAELMVLEEEGGELWLIKEETKDRYLFILCKELARFVDMKPKEGNTTR